MRVLNTPVDIENGHAIFDIIIEHETPVTVKGVLVSDSAKFITLRQESRNKSSLVVYPKTKVIFSTGKVGEDVELVLLEKVVVAKHSGTVKYDREGNLIVNTENGEHVFINYTDAHVTVTSDLTRFAKSVSLESIPVEESETEHKTFIGREVKDDIDANVSVSELKNPVSLDDLEDFL